MVFDPDDGSRFLQNVGNVFTSQKTNLCFMWRITDVCNDTFGMNSMLYFILEWTF